MNTKLLLATDVYTQRQSYSEAQFF